MIPLPAPNLAPSAAGGSRPTIGVYTQQSAIVRCHWKAWSFGRSHSVAPLEVQFISARALEVLADFTCHWHPVHMCALNLSLTTYLPPPCFSFPASFPLPYLDRFLQVLSSPPKHRTGLSS